MAKLPDDRHNTGNSGNTATPVLHASIPKEFEAAIVAWGATDKPENKLPNRSEMIRLAVYAYIQPTLELIGCDYKYIAGTSSDLSDDQKRTASWLTDKYLVCVSGYSNREIDNMDDEEAMRAIATEKYAFIKRWRELNPFASGTLKNAVTQAKSIPESRTLIEKAEHSLGILALEQSLIQPAPRVRRTKEQVIADKAAQANS